MVSDRPYRTLDDLQRAVRALATEFKTDKVVIIGSQAVLLHWPNAPTSMRKSPEIDAYPGNAKSWEIEEQKNNPGMEASEHINGVFGYGSQFHHTHGFYIDGVDENTAGLPPDWEKRALVRPMEVGGRTVLIVAPCPEDLIASKLARLDPKDKEFVEAYHAKRPLDLTVLEERVRASKFARPVEERAIAYIRTLSRKP